MGVTVTYLPIGSCITTAPITNVSAGRVH